MLEIISNIEDRLAFDGLENSFDINIDFITEIESVFNNKNSYFLKLNEDVELYNDSYQLVSIIYVNIEDHFEKIVDELLSEIVLSYSIAFKKNNSKHFNLYLRLYFIFTDIGLKYKFENFTNSKKSLSIRNFKKPNSDLSQNKIFKPNNIIISYDYFSVLNTEKIKYKIDVSSRVSVANYKIEEKKLSGYVFTAKLKDIVDIFKVRSNELFKDNVRYSISDKNFVDQSILKTLETAPWEFWYLNNGITIFTSDEIDLSQKQCITFKSNNFSVINGAQTIASATNFFLTRMDPKLTMAENKAFVLLRVVKGDKSLVNEITIALNRQKPIVLDDISYLSNEITNLNLITSEIDIKLYNKFIFQIVRRGEATSIYSHNYDLASISRMLTAVILKKPGFARAGGINQILNLEQIKRIFVHVDNVTSFIKYYGFINYAFGIENQINEYKKGNHLNEFLDKDKQLKNEYTSILSYGKYHLICAIINSQIRINEIHKHIEFKDLDKELFIELLILFREVWHDFYKETYEYNKIWDSNMFKSDKEIKGSNFLNNYISKINQKKILQQLCVTKIIKDQESITETDDSEADIILF